MNTTTALQIRKLAIPKAFGLVVAVATLAANSVTPNYAWMGVLTPEALEGMSHGTLFTDVIIPVFRPSLHLEKILLQTCGVKCTREFNQWLYAILAFLISECIASAYLTIRKNNQGTIVALASCSIVLMPIYLSFASFGSFVDLTYVLSIIVLVRLSVAHSVQVSGSLFLALAIAVGDLSRPYFLIAFIPFALCLTAKRGGRMHIWLAIGLGIAMVFPYHVAQYRKSGNLLLSNWGGCNLAEVFETPFPTNQAYQLRIPRNSINSIEASRICREIARYVVSESLRRPSYVFQSVARPRLLLANVLPTPFRRDVPFKVSDKRAVIVARILLGLLFVLPIYAIFVFVLTRSSAAHRTMAIGCILPLMTSVVAHGGAEAIRLSTAFLLPMLYYSLTILGHREPKCS